MPTVEDYVEEEEDQQQSTDSFVFDDDTDLPLPGTTPANPSNSTPRRALPNAGTRGALLSHIDDDEVDFDLAKIQAQGRGIENVGAPAASSRSATVTRSTDDGSNRPTAPAGGMPGMGGIMGDLMKIQEAEDQRMKKLEKQLGSTRFVKNPEEFKRCVGRSSGAITPSETESSRLLIYTLLHTMYLGSAADGTRSTRSTLMQRPRPPPDAE
jgi:hypothetical protein